MDDLLSEFLTETNEGLAELDVELVKLEQNPNDDALLGNIFRLMHTIKGTCGFLGLPRLETVAHAGENVLGRIREGELEVTPGAVSLILECLDQIRSLLYALEQTEAEPEGDDSDLIDRLDRFAEGGEALTLPAETADELPADEPPANEPEIAEEVVPQAEAEPAAAAPVAKGAAEAGGAEGAKESSVASQSIRVNVDLLENLMTMVSELVLTRNQLLQILRSHQDSEFVTPLQRLNHVVSELQEGVMKTRMQPIGNAWAKLPRIVRDLSLELGKKVDLVMRGAETELDRQVLDLIKDPLTHMVRNSADHGLESTQERITAGKPETGRITLNAYHEGGHIIIEISDDGRGLSVDKIKKKAIESGLASESELESMTEQQIHRLIFKAGFSTAAAVTSVSGRGVGMDVVRANIERIGGTVELTSVEGKGTTFIIKIPLTLAIVSALIVECAGERFAIPQISVLELVRATKNSETTIEQINNTPVLRLRNRLLPLVSLRELMRLHMEPESGPEADSTQERATTARSADSFIVVTQVGSYTFGIIVDRVFDTEEIVVKPVARILRDIQMFSGNTILGDGSVVMILDPNGIAAATGEVEIAEDADAADADEQSTRGEDATSVLIFRAGDKAPKAVPLSLVARLEEIDLAAVESSNGQTVVQYRGQIMPLVEMDGAKPLADKGRRPVLVFTERERSMGLIVDEIVDIVHEHLNIELTASRNGYIGSAVLAEKSTDVIDVSYYLTQAYRDWFGGERFEAHDGKEPTRVLLVDDSPFFRNLLSPLLAVAGYEVTAVENASSALQLCESGETYDVIVSDIDMPGMSGFEFAEAVKKDSRWCDIPIVALSCFATPRDLAKGRAVGFRDYVAKNDREALLTSLHDTLAEIRGAA
ncbi:MAG TPA: chemotaxis protein CheW [Kiloniellales bacterium]|nr:chemotaxis protein CheW [Kiloniellales bacterium]